VLYLAINMFLKIWGGNCPWLVAHLGWRPCMERRKRLLLVKSMCPWNNVVGLETRVFEAAYIFYEICAWAP